MYSKMDIESVCSSVSTEDEIDSHWIQKFNSKRPRSSQTLPIPKPNPDMVFAVDCTDINDDFTTNPFEIQKVVVGRNGRMYSITAFPEFDEESDGHISRNLSCGDFGLIKELSMIDSSIDMEHSFDDSYELFQLDD